MIFHSKSFLYFISNGIYLRDFLQRNPMEEFEINQPKQQGFSEQERVGVVMIHSPSGNPWW